ncbi:JAB domain-containing protein [Caldalkalibacillus uzonensis]|uniref:JAB domain-containing protein n=1 Tax=Caldalkalibacillus uzonensis TaxID=353224 RepID=UPI0027D7AB81|nr:JAB domain-containing protein [Caldalkalibacillus uzonensis]
MRTPDDAADYLKGIFKDKVQEHFYCLCLDTKNQIIHERTIFVGSLNASIVPETTSTAYP